MLRLLCQPQPDPRILVKIPTQMSSLIKPSVVPPPQESMDNGPSLFDYGLDDPYDDLIDDFDPYLECGKGYRNRTAFEDAFYG